MKLKLKEIFYYARAFAVWTLMAAAVGAVCGVVGGAFAIVVEHATHLRQHTSWLPWLMPVAGLAIAGLYWLLKLPLSIGTDEIIKTVRTQEGVSLKMAPAIFVSTALTLSVGFKGGEIVPSFFIGATLGCVVAPLIGFDPALGAGVGIISMFCGVTNGALASMVLSVELFGAEYLPLFGIACAVSYAMSGHVSLYHSQTFDEPKMGHRDAVEAA